MNMDQRIARLEKRARTYRNISILIVAAFSVLMVVAAKQDKRHAKDVVLKGLRIVDGEGHTTLELGSKKGALGIVRAFAPKAQKPGIVCGFDTSGKATLAVLSKDTGNIVAEMSEGAQGTGQLRALTADAKGATVVSADESGGYVTIFNKHSKPAFRAFVANKGTPGSGVVLLQDPSAKSGVFLGFNRYGGMVEVTNANGQSTVQLANDKQLNGTILIADRSGIAGGKGRILRPWN